MSADEKITTTCMCCGVTFQQPNDPGRKRVYCSSACRQRVYRARNGVTGHEARQRSKAQERERAEREAREQERRRAEDAARARARRERERARTTQAAPSWARPNSRDTAAQARSRMRAAKLWERAEHRGTPAAEAKACRERAEAIRAKHGW